MLSFALLVVLPAQAAPPPGYSVAREGDGCIFYLGPTDAAGLRPAWVECIWHDVRPDRLRELLARWEDHDLYFSSVAACDRLGDEGGKVRALQVHQASGIADRQATLLMWASGQGGATRYEWTLAPTQEPLAQGRVQVARDDGWWQVSAHAEGGSQVTYFLDYHPGGSVPGFLVRWFQSSGLSALVGELHTRARS